MVAIGEATRSRPDVVLMDIRMPRLDGIEAARRIIALGPEPAKVVMLTTFDLDEYVFEALSAGATGFLLKHARPEELLFGIRAAAGRALVGPKLTRRLIERFASNRPSAAPELDRLTEREREVLILLARGRSNAEIARELFVGESTAKTHVARVFTKLGLRDRAQAVIYGYETGLVTPGGHAWGHNGADRKVRAPPPASGPWTPPSGTPSCHRYSRNQSPGPRTRSGTVMARFPLRSATPSARSDGVTYWPPQVPSSRPYRWPGSACWP
jgi:DNA-binding NarL/FixJ family response regulator